MATRKTRSNTTRAKAIFSAFHHANPTPKGELHWTNPYTLLVAVTLSAQATDVGVNKATRPLFERVSTPQELLDLGEQELENSIRTIGLFRTKCRNLIKMAQILIDEHKGHVPRSHDALTALPGVGRKTANVVLNIAFGEPTLAVDTHIFRLAHRLSFSKAKSPDGVERDLLAVIPDEFLQHAHHWLILHGRYICKARTPDCAACLIADHCPSRAIVAG